MQHGTPRESGRRRHGTSKISFARNLSSFQTENSFLKDSKTNYVMSGTSSTCDFLMGPL